jgi:hypothetical protein
MQLRDYQFKVLDELLQCGGGVIADGFGAIPIIFYLLYKGFRPCVLDDFTRKIFNTEQFKNTQWYDKKNARLLLRVDKFARVHVEFI